MIKKLLEQLDATLAKSEVLYDEWKDKLDEMPEDVADEISRLAKEAVAITKKYEAKSQEHKIQRHMQGL